MVPGSAPVFIFVSIARLTDIRTALGSVILTSVFYVVSLPGCSRCLRFFPDRVVGTRLVLAGDNLIAVYGGIVISRGAASIPSPSRVPIRRAVARYTTSWRYIPPASARS